MRVLHVVWTLESSAGGPPVVAVCLAAAQAALGHQVSILTYSPRPGHPETQPPAYRDAAPVVIDRVPASGLEYVLCGRARRRLRQVVPNMNIVHVHGVWAPIGRAACLVAAEARTPCCIAPHGMLDPWALNSQGLAKRLKKHAAIRLSLRRLIRRAAFLHVLNADEERLLSPLQLRARAEIIPNGVSPDEFEPLPPPDAFLARRPELGARPYILFLSRLHAKKGLDLLVDAFAAISREHPHVDLVIAGPDDGFEAPLRRHVQDLGLSPRVHIVGPLDGMEKVAALAGCFCLCLPSRQEGFSMAVLEAMALGRPVVISDACHFPEVEEADAGLVVPCAASPLAEALRSMLRDSDHARRRGDNARNLVRARFTWHAAAVRSIAAYERAVSARRTGGRS